MSYNFIDFQKCICKDEFEGEYAFMSDVFVIDLFTQLIITYKEMCEVNDDIDYKLSSVQLITYYFCRFNINDIKACTMVERNLIVINDIDDKLNKYTYAAEDNGFGTCIDSAQAIDSRAKLTRG